MTMRCAGILKGGGLWALAKHGGSGLGAPLLQMLPVDPKPQGLSDASPMWPQTSLNPKQFGV